MLVRNSREQHLISPLPGDSDETEKGKEVTKPLQQEQEQVGGNLASAACKMISGMELEPHLEQGQQPPPLPQSQVGPNQGTQPACQ